MIAALPNSSLDIPLRFEEARAIHMVDAMAHAPVDCVPGMLEAMFSAVLCTAEGPSGLVLASSAAHQRDTPWQVVQTPSSTHCCTRVKQFDWVHCTCWHSTWDPNPTKSNLLPRAVRWPCWLRSVL